MPHFYNEIKKLNHMLLNLSNMTAKMVNEAIDAIEQHNIPLAQQIIQQDREIDRLEVELEEECLKILALYQPVARDLRFVIAALKINNDLERIGDLATNIAERTVDLAKSAASNPFLRFSEMAEATSKMVQDSISAFIAQDLQLARHVMACDDKVDEMNDQAFIRIKKALIDSPEHVESYLHYLAIPRYLERIADHATNIAEDIIYMLEGGIERHHLHSEEEN